MATYHHTEWMCCRLSSHLTLSQLFAVALTLQHLWQWSCASCICRICQVVTVGTWFMPLLSTSHAVFPDVLRSLQLKIKVQSQSLTFLFLLRLDGQESAERSGMERGYSSCSDNCVLRVTGCDLCDPSETFSNYLRILTLFWEMLLSLTCHPSIPLPVPGNQLQ